MATAALKASLRHRDDVFEPAKAAKGAPAPVVEMHA
jgi:hypothetical protein